MNNKHPIIAHGELYAEPIAKPLSPGRKDWPHDYSEAKQRILTNLSELESAFEDSGEIFLEEKIVCFRLEPKFEAKSYIPTTLVSALSDNAQIIGGRKYTYTSSDGQDEIDAKLYFVRTSCAGLKGLRSTLESGSRDGVQQWRHELQSLNSIDLLSADEKVMGFDDSWNQGTVEFVLHPLPGNTDNKISEFLKISGIKEDSVRIKTYDDGITFISATCSSDSIDKIKNYNPLRAVHPMGRVDITRAREIAGSTCPNPASKRITPTVKVGVFDGGVDPQIPILKGYVTNIDGTPAPAVPAGIEHGSGVCSALLYGNLAGLSAANTLEPPCVSIDCYRVLPLKNSKDIDLYEVIDLIENVVPSSVDTKLYNLSLGPSGAIIDDSISRFTYALDKLSYDVPEGTDNPLFVVAVGNDGELPPSFNRIQAPSDLVNGLGIGAHTYNAAHEKTPASYSCIGPGREGAKTKPDLLAFGGDGSFPFIIPGKDHKRLAATAGTSFAAPLVTGKLGRLMAMGKKISPHMCRTLLIHNAVPDFSFPKIQQGFGFCPDNIENVLECTDNDISIMYSGKIMPTQFLTLPIFAPRINEMSGMVTISWTVALVVDPNSNDPDAYTNNCIEDVFSPHSMVYNFTKKGCTSQKINLLDVHGVARAKELIDTGYRRSAVPVSHSAKKVWDEEDLRAVEFKWDTVIHKSVRMRCQSLFNPTLTLHAMGRNGFENKPMKYHVVISINAPKYNGSLYDAVLQTYQNLSPVEIRNVSRIMYK